ncbi:MAG: hypothetical protein HY277_02065, partial [Ignavibacteriales bacterium]|nr:hypothetical protein [Ignavibacteriales bacterium]
MTGRAIILIVAGIIIISGVILYRIEASSTSIVANASGYFKMQSARNIAQSGVNLSLRQLGYNHAWRTGFSSLTMLGGTVSVRLFDTTFAGISTAIGVRSTGTVQDSSATSTAFCYFPPGLLPIGVKGLFTLHATNQINGGIIIDGRNYDLSGNVIPGTGIYGIWTTGDTFAIGGSGQVGGTTSGGVDIPPSGSVDTSIVKIKQVF